MLYQVNTYEGVCEVNGIRFCIDKSFTAGAYTIICRDVTKGLPPRMQMKNIKILLKIADLTEQEIHQEVTNTKNQPQKKTAGKK